MPYVAKSFIRRLIKDSNKELHKYLVRNLCKVLPKMLVALILEIRKFLVYIFGNGLRKVADRMRPECHTL